MIGGGGGGASQASKPMVMQPATSSISRPNIGGGASNVTASQVTAGNKPAKTNLIANLDDLEDL